MVTGHLDGDLRPRYRYHQHYPGRFPDSLDGRYNAEAYDRRQPILNIGDALRQYCGVSAKRYFVAVILEDGTPAAFSGPEGRALEPQVIKKFFDEDSYKRAMTLLDTGVNPENVALDDALGLGGGLHKQNMDFPRSRTHDHRRTSNLEEWEASERQGRKRPRPRHPINEEEPPMPVTISRRGIRIDNSQELWDFYEQRFKNCQQTACKLIAKAWVKAVEPKKQSTHPYTGSDEKAPDWWPKPWGTTKEDRVRHKEPDHLYKRERVYLLNHILKLVVEPKHEHPDVQKLNLNVKKLEEITMEALSGFFADKENPANFRKKPYLTEIFRVAKQQERYKNDEIDGTTEVFVMAEDKVLEMYASETDDGSTGKRDKDQNLSTSKLSTPHGLMASPAHDHVSAASLHSSSLLGGDLPVRGTQFPPPMMPGIGHDQHGFGESNGLSVSTPSSAHPTGNGTLGLDVGVTTSHSSSRRPSIFSPPADYSAQGGTGLYAHQWQTASTAPHTSSVYPFSQQQANPSSTAFVEPVVPINQSQSYMGSSFDGLPRGYETTQSSMFRAGPVSQQSVNASSGYDYVPHDNRDLPDVKPDPAPRNSMH